MTKYKFYIAGKVRNKENILKLCNILKEFDIPYYFCLGNEVSHKKAGLDLNDNKLAEKFETLTLDSESLTIIFESDIEALKNSENLLLIFPAGNSSHIEAGIAYGMGKKCFAFGNYEKLDSLYKIFDVIFKDEQEFRNYLINNIKNK